MAEEEGKRAPGSIRRGKESCLFTPLQFVLPHGKEREEGKEKRKEEEPPDFYSILPGALRKLSRVAYVRFTCATAAPVCCYLFYPCERGIT